MINLRVMNCKHEPQIYACRVPELQFNYQFCIRAQHLPTWIFDLELLLLAKQLGIPVAEVPIEWHEVAGSKLNVVTASLQMLS